MGLGKATQRLRDIWQNHQPSMEQNSNHEEQLNTGKNFSDKDFAASPDNSAVLQTSPPRTWMDIFFNDDLDFLEVQRVNNIVRAAYKEFMTLASKENAWVLSPPVVGSVEEFQEMFHTPPPHGSTVECSIETAILPIPSHLLISLMMDAEKWASTFSHIICHGSGEVVLEPLSKFLSTADTEVVMVNAQFRLPAEFLPRWSTCFLRFRKLVSQNVYAIFDVSTDYFMDTVCDPTQRIEYKRRPSGVIIRQRDEQSEVVWVENAEVEVIDVPKNVCSKFSLTAKNWVSILSHNLNRRRCRLMASGVLRKTHGIFDLLRITENMKRMYLERINPFPSERKWELFTNDNIRISRDMSASCIGYQNDYIATSTVHISLSPTKLFEFLARNNVKFQWPSIMYPEQMEMAVACFTEDQRNCITLRMNSETGDGGAFEDLEFFLQETSMNEYCSFVLSTRMTEMDIHLSFVPRFRRNSVFLRPSGFAIMPAGPGGLQSEASFVMICIRRELENMEADQAIEAMSKQMNDIIYQIIQLQTPSVADDEDPVQDSPK